MKYLTVLGLVTGILCMFLVYASGIFGFAPWVAFLGISTFFAVGGKIEGLKSGLLVNINGVIWGVVILKLFPILPINPTISISIIAGIAIVFMIIQGSIKYFAFIPGVFLGAVASFATNGNWAMVLPTIIGGVIIGFICESVSILVFNQVGKEETVIEKSNIM